ADPLRMTAHRRQFRYKTVDQRSPRCAGAGDVPGRLGPRRKAAGMGRLPAVGEPGADMGQECLLVRGQDRVAHRLAPPAWRGTAPAPCELGVGTPCPLVGRSERACHHSLKDCRATAGSSRSVSQWDKGGGAQRQRPSCRKGRCTSRARRRARSEEHTSELQSRENLVCRLLLEKKNYHAINGREARREDGVEDGLQAFREQGAAVEVVNNKRSGFTLQLLERNGVAKWIDTVG